MLARLNVPERMITRKFHLDSVMKFREARERGEIIDDQLREQWEKKSNINNKR